MALPTLAELDEEIHQVTLWTAWHGELARNAQSSEELCGDLAVISEAKTNSFMDAFHQLKVVFHYFVTLHANGWIHPEPLTSLLHHFKKNLEAEILNAQDYKAILAQEGLYDMENTRQADIVNYLEVRHIVLIAVKDELLLRQQGVQDTWLRDLDLSLWRDV